ncbi:GAF and ANTAR domain-containing protein [Arthrobacter sp. AD-310]
MAEEKTQAAVRDRLADLVLTSPDVEDFLRRLAEFAAADMSAPSSEVFCGITLVRHKKAATVASSDERARAMDEVQYRVKDGPCLAALREAVTVHVPDLANDGRWPEYAAAVASEKINAVLAVPFLAEGSSKAALNLYSEVTYGFTGESIRRAEEFALHASTSLHLALRIAQLADARADLAAAMESRTVIDLAAGVIMAENRCSQHAAMTILKNASSSRNIKLRDVAAAVLASVSNEAVNFHFDA